MLVLDTSAVLTVFIEHTPNRVLVRRSSEDGDLHAPHLTDIEVLQALSGLMRAGKITAEWICRETRTRSRGSGKATFPVASRRWRLTALKAGGVATGEIPDGPSRVETDNGNSSPSASRRARPLDRLRARRPHLRGDLLVVQRDRPTGLRVDRRSLARFDHRGDVDVIGRVGLRRSFATARERCLRESASPSINGHPCARTRDG